MELQFELGQSSDISELTDLYDTLCEHLAGGGDGPGWIKGVYPNRQTAEDGVRGQNLYVARHRGRIIGSFLLRHTPEPAYHQAKWQIAADYEDIFVVYTFAVHPAYLGQGAGTAMMEFILAHAKAQNAKAVRLDVYEKNTPAIRLYQKCGFRYIGTVDLGLAQHGLDWFALYEKLID